MARHRTDHSVEFDRWGESAFDSVVAEPTFGGVFNTMSARHQPLETDLIAFDTFNTMYQHHPRMSGMGNELHRDIVRRVMDSPKYPELHELSVADGVNSVMGTQVILGAVLDSVSEEMKSAAREADEAQKRAEDSKNYAEALVDSDESADDEDIAAANSAAEMAAQQAAAAQSKLVRLVAENGKEISKAVAVGMEKATTSAKAMKVLCDTFGEGTVDPGTGNISERIEIANRIAKSGGGASFRQFLELLGRLIRSSREAEVTKTRHNSGAIVDVTLGDDLSSALDMDVLEFVDPDLHNLSLLKIHDGSLMEYECESQMPKNRGDIILLVDESGSMSGQRDAESKAFVLAAVSLGIRQKRNVRVMMFQHTVTAEYSFGSKKSGNVSTAQQLVELRKMVSRGSGGGTSFDAPLNRAIDTATASERDEADVLLITDGACKVDRKTIDRVRSMQSTRGMRFFGLCVGGAGYTDSLKEFANHVWVMNNLSDMSRSVFDRIA